MGAVLCVEPVALGAAVADLPTAPLVRQQRQRVWSDQVHHIVQLQPGVRRGVDEDVRQSVALVRHPIESGG